MLCILPSFMPGAMTAIPTTVAYVGLCASLLQAQGVSLRFDDQWLGPPG